MTSNNVAVGLKKERTLHTHTDADWNQAIKSVNAANVKME